MIKVTDLALELLQKDEVAIEALRAGLLNYSAYADQIHDQIEKRAMKPVKRGTIVVALSRLAQNLPKVPSLKPEVKITDITVKSSLLKLTFDKTLDIQRKIATLNPYLIPANELISVVEGPSEVSIVFSKSSRDLIEKHFKTKAKEESNDLVCISAELEKSSVKTPNVLYALLSHFASKRINIEEVISTFTELSFIIHQKEMESVISILNTYFISEK